MGRFTKKQQKLQSSWASFQAQEATLPWDYDLAKGDELPVGKRLLRVRDIAFTQRQAGLLLGDGGMFWMFQDVVPKAWCFRFFLHVLVVILKPNFKVNDSFSHERRDILELINSVLSEKVHPREIPLVRVAWTLGKSLFFSINIYIYIYTLYIL